MKIRDFSKETDWPQVWKILEPVFRAGETYAISTSISEHECYDLWVEKPCRTFVVVSDDETETGNDDNHSSNKIVGAYYLKPNQVVGSNGSHVCNCGYVVAPQARGQGLAGKMCEHSLQIAVHEGFVAMQYNFVVATNKTAIKIWKKYGFEIVGTMPLAFCHPTIGFVDAHVMYKLLKPREEIIGLSH